MVPGITSAQSRIIDLDKGEENIRILGDDASDWSGVAVAKGDINGDGYDDIIIGASGADPAIDRENAGETYIIFGSAAPPATVDLNSVSADITIYGDDEWDHSGRSVSSGDVNGDGYDDIIIGVPYIGPAGHKPGQTFVIFGSTTPPATIDLSIVSPDISINSDEDWNEFGVAVSSADVNGDGFDDIIIGAHEADPFSRSDAGITYIFYC